MSGTLSRPRSPLFPTALAFTGGVTLHALGLATPWLLLPALVLGVVWIRVPDSRLQSISFFGLILGGACLYTALRSSALSPQDLRCLSELRENPLCAWQGTIRSEPQRHGLRTNFEFVVDRVSGPGIHQPAEGRILVSLWNREEALYRYGDTLLLPGPLELPPPARGPGQLDYRDWLAHHGIYYRIETHAGAVQPISHHPGLSLIPWALNARDWARHQLTLGLEEDLLVTAVLAGMLFGYRESIPDEIEQAFRQTGTYHIFAVSGQNIAVLLGVGIILLQILGLIKWRHGWLCLPLLFGYALISGLQPSVVRALVMAGLILLAWWVGRPAPPLNLWSAALLCVLIVTPAGLLDIGFQLSFAVVLALIVVTPRLQPLFYAPFAPDAFLPKSLLSSPRLATDGAVKGLTFLAASSLAAFCGSLPLTIWHFHQISPVALPANLLVVPLASLIVVVGSLALLCAPLSSALTVVLNNTNWLLVKILLGAVAWFATISGGHRSVAAPATWFTDQTPVIDLVAVDHGAAALVRYQGRAWLINTGSARAMPYTLQPMLRYYGINRLEGIWITQPNAGSFGGAVLLADALPVGHWIVPPNRLSSGAFRLWLESFAERAIGRAFARTGHTQTLFPPLTATVLGPEPNLQHGPAADKGMVLAFQYGSTRLVWAGNIGFGQEWGILKRFPDLRATVLFQGAHPEESNLSPEWLSQLQPRYVIQPSDAMFRSELTHHDPFRFLPSDQKPEVVSLEKTGSVQLRFLDSGMRVIPFSTSLQTAP